MLKQILKSIVSGFNAVGLCWFTMYLYTDDVAGNCCRVSGYWTLVTPTWTHLVLVFPQRCSGMVLNLFFLINCPLYWTW